MPASFHTSVHDAALAVIASANALHICSGNPTTRAAAISASLATVALTSGDFAAPTTATPDGRGRTVAAKTGVAVTAAGTPAHYCLIDGTNLIAKTEVNPASPNLTTGSTTDIPAVTFSVADPAVV